MAGYSGPFPFACLSGAFHSPGPQLGLRKGSIVPQNRPNHARSPHCQGCSEIPVRFLGIRSSAFTASRPPAPWLRLLMGNARISLFMKSLVATATGSSFPLLLRLLEMGLPRVTGVICACFFKGFLRLGASIFTYLEIIYICMN